ncbi:MAG: hypothetical protein R3B09_25290 [Nannocystaceae bacterium]
MRPTRLLEDALALESAGGLDRDARDFVASAIQLLTADLHRPAVAEDLSIQTAAYRDLIAHGHPRIADNARWRIYDHVRGCLQGAAGAPPARRPTIALHSLYAAEDSIDAHLDDRAVHARPPLPEPSSLLAMIEEERAALTAIGRWAPVIARRRAFDETLRSTTLQALPAPRDPTWEVAEVPVGTGREESLAPIVRIDGDQAIIDLGRPAEARAALGTGEAAKRLEAALAADGRGVVLFVAPPMLPSPVLRGAFAALLGARVATVELAVKEPRVPEGSGDVIVALPLEVLRASDQGPAAVILSKARVHAHLDGRGPRFAVDGRWLAARPNGERELDELLGALDRAYPRERLITLSLGEDVLYQQLLDLLRVLVGGQGRRYDVVAWSVDRDAATIATPTPADAEDRRLKVRADLWRPDAKSTIVQPFPLPGDDQKRLEAMARQLTRCIPEYEAALPAKGLGLHMVFEEGRMATLSVIGARKGKGKQQEREAAVIACANEESRGFRLREQRDKVEMDVILSLK